MATAVLVSRILLAVVFAAAAVGKVLDPSGSRQAAVDFGLPRRLAGVAARVLPAIELIIAISLLVQPAASAGALAAVLVLAVFVTAIARLMRRGEAAECHCFGQLHSSVAGRSTLLRTVCLGALAAFVVTAGPGLSLAALTGQELALLGTSLAAAMAAVIAVSLWRENRRLRARGDASAEPVQGLPQGSPLPELELRYLDGALVTIADAAVTGKPTVLVQVDLGCGPCHDLMPELVRWTTVLAEELTLTIVSSGDLEPNRVFAASFGAPGLLVSPGREFGTAFNLHTTPSAVYVDARGRIAATPAVGAGAIEALVRSARRDVDAKSSAADARRIGPLSTPVPNGTGET